MQLNTEQLLCNTEIDYSTITSDDTIIPFVFSLDLINSVLNPPAGQNQRFCYDVLGVGEDQPQFKDLSHFVLGICPQITADQIVNVSVVIDGEEQPIDKVELKTPEDPDKPTGCAGLKFDYGLNKLGGEMKVCFELTTPYPVGPNLVCVFGGSVGISELSICGPVCGETQTCTAKGFQRATICVPVTVKPFAIAGATKTTCCGKAVIRPGEDECEGVPNGECHFTIKQDICVEVPIQFGAMSHTSTPSVQCGDATDEDICTNCNGDDSAALMASASCPTCNKA